MDTTLSIRLTETTTTARDPPPPSLDVGSSANVILILDYQTVFTFEHGTHKTGKNAFICFNVPSM